MTISKGQWLTRILSISAFIISIISAGLSWRSHFLIHRPYVGIEKIKEAYEKGESSSVSRMSWQMIFKNTGSLPAIGKVVKREVSVVYGKEVFKVPLRSNVKDASFFVMPGANMTLAGDVPENEHVALKRILEGEATVYDFIRIEYHSSKPSFWFWNESYFYENRLQYLGGKGGHYFTSTKVNAD